MLLRHGKLTTALALYITSPRQRAHQTPLLLCAETEQGKSSMKVKWFLFLRHARGKCQLLLL